MYTLLSTYNKTSPPLFLHHILYSADIILYGFLVFFNDLSFFLPCCYIDLNLFFLSNITLYILFGIVFV